tara:strand:- start:196 stop:405 length:210 start_codon:yes stop_codon:yes gene_type:complete
MSIIFDYIRNELSEQDKKIIVKQIDQIQSNSRTSTTNYVYREAEYCSNIQSLEYSTEVQGPEFSASDFK